MTSLSVKQGKFKWSWKTLADSSEKFHHFCLIVSLSFLYLLLVMCPFSKECYWVVILPFNKENILHIFSSRYFNSFYCNCTGSNFLGKTMRFITRLILYYFGVFRRSGIVYMNLLLFSKGFLFYVFPRCSWRWRGIWLQRNEIRLV